MIETIGERSIERLVQQKKTGLYFKSPSEWTPDPEAATRFGDLLSVITFCYECAWTDVELILKDTSAQHAIRLDIGIQT